MTRRFGQQTNKELEEARCVASAAVEVYGDFANDAIWRQFRQTGIWNDHAAVQAALRVIMSRNDELEEVLAELPYKDLHTNNGDIRQDAERRAGWNAFRDELRRIVEEKTNG